MIAEPPDPPDPDPEPAPVSKQDYVRAAIPPALGAVVLRLAIVALSPALSVLAFAVPGAAGYMSVRLFEQRSAPIGGIWQGCGLGALTGLLCFLPSLVVQLATFAMEGRESVLSALREQEQGSPMVTAALAALEDPLVFALVIAFGIFVEACLLLAVSGAGGALAAKASVRESD